MHPFAIGVLVALVVAVQNPGQDAGETPHRNSTRKIRPPLGEQAARVGCAVPWRKDVAAALAEAKASGRLVFWYVPTVARSPMDRKPEIDRYLRGGPFSWPTTIELLATRFVAVDEKPAGELQRRFGLLRNEFIEPGYLVLDGDGTVKLRVDQITTLHPEWFEAPLRRLAKAPNDGFPGAPALREAWDAYRRGDRPAAIALAESVLQKQPASAVAAEAHWLCGAALCRDNRPRAARERWQHLVTALPDEPLAWKAALEVEGHGPFVHGFEDFLPLPAAVLATDPVDGSRAPEAVYDEATLWRRSVSFLLAMGDGEGVVRDSIYDFGGTDSLPNVHAAVTCLVGMALLAAEERFDDGRVPAAPKLRAATAAMLERIRANIADDAWLQMSDRDEIVWARAYAIRFLAAFRRHHAADDEALPALQRSVAALLALQPATGAWFHEYGNPFATATALQALFEASVAGVEIDADKAERGLRALARDRTAEGAFTYGHTERGAPQASVAGAAGRMPLCELALYLFDRSDQARLQQAVTHGVTHHDKLAAVRKYDDHADRLHYGGFFFWFDMLGRTEAMQRLAAGEVRQRLLATQLELILKLPEFDGCFVDSHELGRAYGTAMALSCLAELPR
ncbi:MAG: terpene cyclase/mutase family protein [Planctomycetes bacterium]|nr:terpene cyclase/mutase family protein [Planctomycetota bacterium]